MKFIRNTWLVAFPVVLWLFGGFPAFAQTDSTANTDTTTVEETTPEKQNKLAFNGYVKDLVTVAIPSLNGIWTFDNQIHNRLNLKYYATDWLTFSVEARNRIYFGESVKTNPVFKEQIDQSLDYLRLGGIVLQKQSFLFHSVIDRANVKVEKGRWQAVLGKQRINWGKSQVWNPNDWFNAYSFFDFDYEERRGTDAALVKYSTGSLSSLEAAINLDSTFDRVIAAANYRTNIQEYDFQLLVGKYRTDLAFGAGWAGQLKGAGLKGELTYFQPYKNDGSKATFVGDVSLDYTLPNTLGFRLEMIGNTNPQQSGALEFLTQPVSAKGLINNYFSSFVSVGYEITPLIKTNVSSIWNVDDGSVFFNPTLDISLSENTNWLLASQIFTGGRNSLYNQMGSYVFTRLKWSF